MLQLNSVDQIKRLYFGGTGSFLMTEGVYLCTFMTIQYSSTSMTGGDAGGALAACFTTRLSRRISVPAGGPSK